MFGIMYVATGLGVTVGFHRLFTHRSFKTRRPVRAILAVLGSAALAGLAHAHVGWLFIHTQRGKRTRYAPDLLEDLVVRFVDRTFVLRAVGGLAAAFGLGVAIGGSVEAGLTNDGGAAGGLLIILGWAGAVATSLAIRPAYLQAASSSFVRARTAAERRLEERREGQRLAAEQPELAIELGIGRPDRRGGRSAGLVDVNNAPASALVRLPGSMKRWPRASSRCARK